MPSPVIFIVEDESAHFTLMRRAILKELPDASIQCFDQAEACIGELEIRTPEIIIVDYMMPGMNGLEFLDVLNRTGKGIPVLMVTGQGNEGVAARAMQAGAWDYLVKSTEFFELLPCIVGKVLREKGLQRSLKESEQRYRSVGDLLPFGFWLCGPDGEIRYLSDSFLQLVDMTLEECRHFEWTKRLSPEDAARTLGDWRQCVVSGGFWDYEYRILGADGRYRTILSRGCPLKDAQGRITGWAGINLDITERKKAEDQLRHYLTKLELRERELQDFAFAASHDLQEPLRKIQTFGDILEKECQDLLLPEHRDFLQRMIRSAGRMRNLVQSLVSYCRVGVAAPSFTSVPLGDVVKAVLRDLGERVHEIGAKVEVGDLPVIEGDLEQLQLLFRNLVVNALTCFKEGEKPLIRISGYTVESPIGTQYALVVQDNGIGFDKGGLRRVFRPFSRQHGRSNYDSAGIGLAICRRIVARHGGTITATSAPGKGSTFVITLPFQQLADRSSEQIG